MSDALRVVVADDDPTPPFEQVRAQIAGLITAGLLPSGARLPPLRQLAADLGLAVGTVGRAYRELESVGLVVSRRGGGTRVAAPAAPAAPSRTGARLEALASRLVADARGLGADDDEVVEAVRAALTRRPGEVDPAHPCRAEEARSRPSAADRSRGLALGSVPGAGARAGHVVPPGTSGREHDDEGPDQVVGAFVVRSG
ncbi:GntR family transcriptional regulator [Pseudokineococcus sp. 1T1Z-3]|uniref:GntR family transcriptional regulator n=1 Tax=Pseudokineococcus sp. 1T1Z-3 TaxID=3132745 RepID=UPI0030A8014A